VLGAVALFTLGRALWPVSASSWHHQPEDDLHQCSQAKRPATASGKFVKDHRTRLDPTLDLDLLRQTEQIKYAGTARNILSLDQCDRVGARKSSRGDGPDRASAPPPPPAYQLKIFRFRQQFWRPKKIFLSSGEDIFIATEGDIVNRRYRVLHISPTPWILRRAEQ